MKNELHLDLSGCFQWRYREIKMYDIHNWQLTGIGQLSLEFPLSQNNRNISRANSMSWIGFISSENSR